MIQKVMFSCGVKQEEKFSAYSTRKIQENQELHVLIKMCL